MKLSILIVVSGVGVFAQTISLGVVGGGSVTDAFPEQNSFTFTSPPLIDNHFFSQSKDYLVGGMFELGLGSRWSLEADGLFRQLHLMAVGGPRSVVTWEFPILTKYRLLSQKSVSPFIEAGPSLRTRGNLNGTLPSHYGVTAGVGAELHWRGWNISPAARYTRWGLDPARIIPQSGRNQVELLAGFSRRTESNWRPFGHRFSLGVILGTNLTGDYRDSTQTQPSPLGFQNTLMSGPRNLIAGPTIELRLATNLSLEVDALSHPISRTSDVAFGGVIRRTEFKFATWEFPILAKYKFRIGRVDPFIAVGPSFRSRPKELNASPFGAAAEAGLQIRAGHLKIAPGIRYTHWAADKINLIEGARRNQSQLLVGFSF